jgi:hypothetical protein
MGRLTAVSAVLVSAVILGGSAGGCSSTHGGSTAVLKPSSFAAATTTASAAPVERTIRTTQFGSSKAKWHKALASVIVRGDTMVIKVTRDLSGSEAGQIEAAAKVARRNLSLPVTQFQIQDASSGYLLKYGSL